MACTQTRASCASASRGEIRSTCGSLTVPARTSVAATRRRPGGEIRTWKCCRPSVALSTAASPGPASAAGSAVKVPPRSSRRTRVRARSASAAVRSGSSAGRPPATKPVPATRGAPTVRPASVRRWAPAWRPSVVRRCSAAGPVRAAAVPSSRASRPIARASRATSVARGDGSGPVARSGSACRMRRSSASASVRLSGGRPGTSSRVSRAPVAASTGDGPPRARQTESPSSATASPSIRCSFAWSAARRVSRSWMRSTIRAGSTSSAVVSLMLPSRSGTAEGATTPSALPMTSRARCSEAGSERSAGRSGRRPVGSLSVVSAAMVVIGERNSGRCHQPGLRARWPLATQPRRERLSISMRAANSTRSRGTTGSRPPRRGDGHHTLIE